MDTLAGLTLGQIFGGMAGGAAVLSIFVEISPIKVNPISALLRWMGKKINAEVIAKVDRLEGEMKRLKDASGEQAAVSARARILRFGDEVLHGTNHSKDHFDQTLRDIDYYNAYCREHPLFLNSVTGIVSDKIRECYKERLEKNDFL